MIITIIFLLTCVITARIFERKNMRAAAVAYALLFAVVLLLLLFAVDIPIVERALTNAIGAAKYAEIASAIDDAMSSTLYGISMISVIGAVFAVQTLASIIEAARVVAVYCFKKEALIRKFKKVYSGALRYSRELCLPRQINKIYCRMLN